MKYLVTSLLLFACCSLGLTQSDWLVDSVSRFRLSEDGISEPYFVKYHYNADQDLKERKDKHTHTFYSYGTHTESSTTVYNIDNSRNKIYKEVNIDNQVIYNKGELTNDDGDLYTLYEEFSEYEDGHLILQRYKGNHDWVEQYSYNDFDKIDRIESYKDDFLSESAQYTYDDQGRLIDRLVTDEISGDYKRYSYSFDIGGGLLEYVYTNTRDSYEEKDYTSYRSGNGVDSIVVLSYANSLFSRGVLVTVYVVEGDKFYNRFNLAEPRVNSAELQWYTVSRSENFRHGDEISFEQHLVEGQDTFLFRQVTFETKDLKDLSYTLVEKDQRFDSGGTSSAFELTLNDYIRIYNVQELDNSIKVKLSPNPIAAGEYMDIDIGQDVLSKGIIYDSQGRKVQELEIGGKRSILWRAPDIPGHYYIVFVAEDGSSLQPKAFHVY